MTTTHRRLCRQPETRLTGHATMQALVLGAVFATIVLTWFSAYAVLASTMRPQRWDVITPVLTRITGVVLIGFAVRLAARL